jgi:SAM-dependent methyltransferase
MSVVNGNPDDSVTALLACPKCRTDLFYENSCYRCSSCGNGYPVVNEIPQFAMAQENYQEDPDGIAFRKRYEWQYNDIRDAAKYDESFRKSRRKRQRTSRELSIVEAMLSRQGKCRTILDVPCGGGRLSGPISNKTQVLIEADISLAQIHLALSQNLGNQRGMMISALALPFESEALDGSVCARLSHHLPDPAERELLISELMRVSSRFCIFSFTDRDSIQSFGRKLRGKKLNPCSMSVDEISSIVKVNGGKVDDIMTVSSIGPRHRWALISK